MKRGTLTPIIKPQGIGCERSNDGYIAVVNGCEILFDGDIEYYKYLADHIDDDE